MTTFNDLLRNGSPNISKDKMKNLTIDFPCEFQFFTQYKATTIIDTGKEGTKFVLINPDKGDILIEECIFKEDVKITSCSQNITFKNCTFEKELSFQLKQENKAIHDVKEGEGNSDSKITVDVSDTTISIIDGKINCLNINNSKLYSRFYINSQYKKYDGKIAITDFKTLKTIFYHNFKLHNAVVDIFEMEDVDFEKNADFFMSHIKQGVLDKNEKEKINQNDIGFKAINFRRLALFGETIFDRKLIFKYVTIEGFSHFRNATFKQGLDLDYVNIQNNMNFFGSTGLEEENSRKNTSQETYRIIKHNFENLGNKIEANKYHALELDQKRRKLDKEKNDWKEQLVFDIHNISSEHSTNWLLPLQWIAIIGCISTFAMNPSWNLLFLFAPFIVSFICTEALSSKLWLFIISFILIASFDNTISIKDIMNNMALINLVNSDFVLTKEYTKGDLLSSWNAGVLFVNKALLGYLYYQFLMSVRKDTRK